MVCYYAISNIFIYWFSTFFVNFFKMLSSRQTPWIFTYLILLHVVVKISQEKLDQNIACFDRAYDALLAFPVFVKLLHVDFYFLICWISDIWPLCTCLNWLVTGCRYFNIFRLFFVHWISHLLTCVPKQKIGRFCSFCVVFC